MFNILSHATDGPRVSYISTSLSLSSQYISAFFRVTLQSFLSKCTHHLRVLGMVAMDQCSTGMSLMKRFWDSWLWREDTVENGRNQRPSRMKPKTSEGRGRGWTHCEPKTHGSTVLCDIHWWRPLQPVCSPWEKANGHHHWHCSLQRSLLSHGHLSILGSKERPQSVEDSPQADGFTVQYKSHVFS